MDVQPRPRRELLEEHCHDVAAEATDAGEVDVRRDERAVADLDHCAGERLGGGEPCESVPGRPGRAQERGDPLSHAAAGPGHRLVDRARRRLHGELEACGASELAEQVVEDAEPGRDGGALAERDLHADLCSVLGAHGRRVAPGRQVRSIEAPSARSRSSIRS